MTTGWVPCFEGCGLHRSFEPILIPMNRGVEVLEIHGWWNDPRLKHSAHLRERREERRNLEVSERRNNLGLISKIWRDSNRPNISFRTSNQKFAFSLEVSTNPVSLRWVSNGRALFKIISVINKHLRTQEHSPVACNSTKSTSDGILPACLKAFRMASACAAATGALTGAAAPHVLMAEPRTYEKD